MENPISGIIPLPLNGTDYKLQFTWNAVAQISRKFGTNTNLFDPDVLAQVVAIGLQKHHPEEANAEFVMDASPPLIEVINIVTKGLQYAYFGEKGAPADNQNPLMAGNRKPKETTSPAPSSSPTEPESIQTNSGD